MIPWKSRSLSLKVKLHFLDIVKIHIIMINDECLLYIKTKRKFQEKGASSGISYKEWQVVLRAPSHVKFSIPTWVETNWCHTSVSTRAKRIFV